MTLSIDGGTWSISRFSKCNMASGRERPCIVYAAGIGKQPFQISRKAFEKDLDPLHNSSKTSPESISELLYNLLNYAKVSVVVLLVLQQRMRADMGSAPILVYPAEKRDYWNLFK